MRNFREDFLQIFKYTFLINREGRDAEKELPDSPSLEDEIKRLPAFKISSKIKGLDLIIGKKNELRVSNNIVKLQLSVELN